MRTYLVTGGAGFIGSNYIHYMFQKYDNEIRIINVDKLTYAGNLENLKDIENRDNYTFVKADICDSEAIMKIFDENDIDRVVHFAAESHVDRSIRNPEVFVKTNVLGTLVMLNAAKSAWELPDGTFKPDKKFLHVSTDEVYGSLEEDGGFFYETTPYDPHSPYSASKASSDMLVKSYMDTYKFPANITNCSNNYGPYQFPEKLIPLIINNALQGKKLPVVINVSNTPEKIAMIATVIISSINVSPRLSVCIFAIRFLNFSAVFFILLIFMGSSPPKNNKIAIHTKCICFTQN